MGGISVADIRKNTSGSSTRSRSHSHSHSHSHTHAGARSHSSGRKHYSGYRSEAHGTDQSREAYRKGISYVFSFILSVFLLLGTVCLTALNSLFSESFFCSVIQDDYYQAVLNQVVTEAEDYTIPVGLDLSVLDGVFAVDDVKRDVNGHVTAAFRGYEFRPNVESENARLYANVAAYLEEGHVAVEGETEDVIQAYIEDIDSIYLDEVPMPGIALIKAAREKVRGAVTAALIILFALSFILAVVLLRLYRYPHQGMRFITYAFGGCALMCFALPFGLYLSKVYEHVLATPEYFYIFVSGYLRCLLESFMKTAALWLIITVGCMVYIYLSKNGMLRGKIGEKISKKISRSLRRL